MMVYQVANAPCTDPIQVAILILWQSYLRRITETGEENFAVNDVAI